MPRKDGLTFLKKLMKYYPCRIIILSSLATYGGEVALTTMDYGALEVIAKLETSYSVADISEQLIEKIKAVSQIPNWNGEKLTKSLQEDILSIETRISTEAYQAMLKTTQIIIAIGTSTGGTEVITALLTKLPANIPPIVIVQHMPQNFTRYFAQRLVSLCNIRVKEAEDNDILSGGRALVEPGNYDMEIPRSGSVYMTKLHQGPMIYHQRPSVESFLNSVAKYTGKNSLGILLTGMGKDGAIGLFNMKNTDATTIPQDEQSYIIYGMPKEAVEIGAVRKILPLDEIANEIIALSMN